MMVIPHRMLAMTKTQYGVSAVLSNCSHASEVWCSKQPPTFSSASHWANVSHISTVYPVKMPSTFGGGCQRISVSDGDMETMVIPTGGTGSENAAAISSHDECLFPRRKTKSTDAVPAATKTANNTIFERNNSLHVLFGSFRSCSCRDTSCSILVLSMKLAKLSGCW